MKKGQKMSILQKEMISNSLKGHNVSELVKITLSNISKGKHPATEFKKGHIVTDEIKEKIRNNAKNNPNYGFKGRKHKEESNIKNRLAHIGKSSWNKGFNGEKSHTWRGGISKEPYSVDWTNTLKRSIRERDKYTCQICFKPQEEISFHIHHIDYNKKNCNPFNLITLCPNCHIKTNYKRDYWLSYFNEKGNCSNK